MTTYYPLTHAQRRVWYIEQIYPSTSVYNIGGLARIDGQVDLQVLEQAIHLFVQKNDGMRLQLTVRDGVPYQYVREHRPERL
ncbi:MAG: condensation domain-containing protein, partial [Tumebacillaceae bacterium]